MGGTIRLMDGGGKRYHQNGVRGITAIAGLDGYDDNGAPAFSRRIGRKLEEPVRTASYSSELRRRRALAMTESELRLIAALASMGLSSQPKNG